MFDYQTHKDFGSGDRICYHGVLDSFRNPKLAAAVYASQGDADPVLAVSSSMDIGDNPAGQLGTAYVFSNAQQVKLYKNDVFVTALRVGTAGEAALTVSAPQTQPVVLRFTIEKEDAVWN